MGLCTVYYIPEHLAFILACYKMKIPSADIQHGLQGDQHIAYSGWKHIYHQLLPTGFWVWSAFEKSNIEKWSRDNGPVVFVGGNLWMDFCLTTDDPEIKIINDEIQEIKNEGKNHILLSLQPNNYLDYFIPILKESPDSWFWWIRLHPRMLEREAELVQLLTKHNIHNYCIKEASYFPLPFILKNIDVHVTFNSTVVLDAELFNIKSLVLDENGIKYFPEQFQRKMAFHEKNLQDSVEKIQFLVEKSKSKEIHEKEDVPKPTERIQTFLALLTSKNVHSK